MTKTIKDDVIKNYKPMSNKKVNFYFLLSERCPIKLIRDYVDKKLQIEMSYTINKANKLIRDSIFRNE